MAGHRFVLNDWSKFRGGGVEVRATPITVDLDPVKLGRPIAEALREELAGAMNRGGQAAPATIAGRESAARAWSAGKAWARRAYPSGPPRGTKLLHASGHLAEHLGLRAERDGFAVTAPPERLRDPEVKRRVMRVLAPMVGKLLSGPRAKAATKAAVRAMVTVGRPR